VTNDQGRPQANVTVQVTDGDGNVVGSAETDSAGNFTVSIPACVVLPLAYVSDEGTVVIDEVGDDTYIPDFEAGNLKFTQVWVEDTLQAGMPTKIWFDVETETPKYNTFVKLYLVKLTTGSIDELEVSGGDFEVAHTLTALSIEQLGQIVPGETVTKTQGQDIVTAISYLNEDNRQAHVEHSFIVPTEVEDGTYAVVFSINRFDYHPEDDALQSEDLLDVADNFLAAPASVIIGQPDKPNLRILSAELNSNSFELPAKRPTEGSTPFSSELTLNMEVESMAQDTKLPVDITFVLEVDGQSYPLTFASNEGSRPSKLDVKSYPVTCRKETRESYPEGDRCASLFRQEQTGYTYKLYINADAYDALAAKTADTLIDLVIQLDPEATVDEWENNTADNIKAMPVMFLVAQEDSDTRFTRRSTRELTNTPYDYSQLTNGEELFSLAGIDDVNNFYGNDDFGAGYEFNATMTYANGSYQGTEYPYAASFDGENNRAYISIFSFEIDMLRIDVEADVNGDKLICSWFEYNVDILEQDIFDEYLYVNGINPSDSSCTPSSNGLNTEEVTQEYELWNSQDDDGNEKYSVSKSKDYEKSFTVEPVPITVAAGATGELGIKGSVVIDTSNTLTLSAGPYVLLNGYAEGGIGITGLNAGIGVDLLILGIELPFTAALQVLPSYPLAEFTFEAPLIITTLDGELYIYAKIAWDQYTYTILEWEGLEWEIPLMDPIVLTWAEPNQFILDTTSGSPPTLDAEAAELNYDWGNQDAFTASWFGWYDFTPGTYSFEATTEGNQELEVKVDVNDDDSYEINKTVTSDAGFSTSTNIGSDTLAEIQVSYDHGSGDAGLSLSWSQINTFFVSYYNNTTFSGNTGLADMEDTIDHDWGASSPDGENNINADGFSVRWKGTYEFNDSGNYIFTVESDDSNVVLKMDNSSVGLTMSDTDGDGIYYGTVTVSVSNGSHDIELEYIHTSGDAKITLDWQPADKRLLQLSASLDTRTHVTVYSASEPTIVRYFEEGEVESMLSPTFILPAEYFSVYSDGYTNSIAEYLMEEFEDIINSEYNNIFLIEYEDIHYNVIRHYKGYFYFDTDATYDFIARVDDGMKFYVDGKQYLGHWNINEASAYIVPITLSAGYHLIEVEHYDEVKADETLIGSKQIKTTTDYQVRELDWTQRQNNEFIGFYYSTLENMEADNPWDPDAYDGAEPLLISKTADAVTGCYFTSSSLSCDWDTYGPTREVGNHADSGRAYLDGIDSTSNIYSNNDGYGYLTVDNFAVRWIGDFYFTQGIYVFTVAADDGVRVWIDDVIVIDQWNIVSDTTTYQEAVAISAGTHNIRIEYWENTGNANIDVSWAEINQDVFNTYYFNTADFMDAAGGPGQEVSTIDHSGNLATLDNTRWVGVFELEEADYTFTVNTDGGVRMYLDGEAIIDEWVAQSSSTTYTATVTVEEGLHSLKMEYLEGNSSNPAMDVS